MSLLIELLADAAVPRAAEAVRGFVSGSPEERELRAVLRDALRRVLEDVIPGADHDVLIETLLEPFIDDSPSAADMWPERLPDWSNLQEAWRMTAAVAFARFDDALNAADVAPHVVIPLFPEAFAAAVKASAVSPDSRLANLAARVEAAELRAAATGSAPPVTVVELQNLVPTPDFVGRDDILTAIESALRERPDFGVVQAASLTGLGGVGKTQIALRYATTHLDEYRVVYLVRCESEAVATADLLDLAKMLGIPANDVVMAVRQLRSRLLSRPDVLIIADNVDDPATVQHLLPLGGRCRVLLTSRNRDVVRLTVTVSVDVWDEKEAVEFLEERGIHDGATELAEQLGGLPLALAQAAGYIDAAGISGTEYLHRLQTTASHLLAAPIGVDPDRTVAAVWQLTLERLAESDPKALHLLRIASYAAPQRLPLDALTTLDGSTLFGEGTPVGAMALDAAVATLRRYSLAERNEGALSVHRLVQLVVRNTVPDTDRHRVLEAAVRVTAAALQLAETLQTRAEVAAHPFAVLQHVAAAGIVPGDADTLAEMVAYAYSEAHLVQQAKQATDLALQFAEDDDARGRLLRARARVSLTAGDAAGAIADLEASRATVRTPTAEVEIVVMAELSLALRAQERFAEAYKVASDALKRADEARLIQLQTVTRSNLAVIAQDVGKFHEARGLLEQALELIEPDAKPQQWLTLRHNLAGLLRELGYLGDARTILEADLVELERVFGGDHAHVARCRNDLALVMQELGDVDTAATHLERAVEINTVSYGRKHPNVAIGLSNLARIRHAQGRIPEAMALWDEAASIVTEILGPRHTQIAAILNNRAAAMRSIGDDAGAEVLMRKALELDAAAYGPHHPETVIDRLNLATTIAEQGRKNEARRELRDALTSLDRTEPNHYYVQHALVSLTNLEIEGGNDSQACAYARRLVELTAESRSKTDSALADRRFLYATALVAVGNLDGARRQLRAAAKAQRAERRSEQLIQILTLQSSVEAQLGNLTASRKSVAEAIQLIDGGIPVDPQVFIYLRRSLSENPP